MARSHVIDLGAALRNSLGVTTPEDDPPVRAVDTEAAAVWDDLSIAMRERLDATVRDGYVYPTPSTQRTDDALMRRGLTCQRGHSRAPTDLGRRVAAIGGGR